MPTSVLRLLFSGFLLCTCVLAPKSGDAQTGLSFSYPAGHITDGLDVYVDDAGTGFLVGTCGVLRTTTNNGQNWNLTEAPTTDDLEAVACPPGGCATALLATDNALYRLRNGSWTEVTYPNYEDGGKLHWLTNNLVVHEAGSSGIWRSTNGGNAWSFVAYGENKSSELIFIDANVGYLFGNNKLIKTEDGGASFSEVGYTHPNSPFYLAWLDANTGWTFDRDRQFWQTTNGGLNWTMLNDEQQLSSIRWFTPLTANHLVAVQGITLAESLDGGVTWTRGQFGVESVKSAGTGFHRSGEEFFVTAGQNQVLYSPAGFTDWVDQNRTTLRSGLTDIVFATNEIGYAIGGINLYRTTNAGAAWEAISLGATLREIGLLPNGDPVVMTDSETLVSRDGGVTFTDLFAPGMIMSSSDNPDLMTVKPDGTVYFFGPLTGFISTDGGSTFSRVEHGLGVFGTSIFFLDDQYGFMVDRNGEFAATTDGGLTWEGRAEVLNARPEAVFFTSPTNGWATSVNRRYLTTDGGMSWAEAPDRAGGYDFTRRAEDGAIYAARWDENTLVRSTDEGATFTALADHCFGYRALALTPNERYAFVAGDGFIVRHDLNELVTSTRQRNGATVATLRAYPNPSAGLFWLEVPQTSAATNVSVFAASGREVMSLQVPAGQSRIALDLGQLPGGVYVARWAAASGKMGTVRLVKR